jgi:hypothetical protein
VIEASRAHSASDAGDELLQSLTVVIPNWLQAEYTLRAARAVMADGVPAARIVVVDNGSGDAEADLLVRELPGCRVIRQGENVGYAAAANAGAAALAGSAYLVLNNDAFVEAPGTIRRMLAALGRDRVGIVAPRLLNPDRTLQPTVRPFDTPLVALVRASGLSRLVPNSHQPRWSTHWDHSESREIDAADGAVLLFRGETWQALGGFPGHHHLYAEETSLCWRARERGWRVWFEHDAEFVHIGNATIRRRWPGAERDARWSRAEALVLREQLSPPRAVLSILFVAAGLAARAAAFALRRERVRAAAAFAQLRGYLSALVPWKRA